MTYARKMLFLLVWAGILGCGVGAGGKARAASKDDFRLRSSDYPVTVISQDPEYGGLVLELLNRSFQHFGSTMGIRTFGSAGFEFVLEGEAPKEPDPAMETLYYGRTLTLGDSKNFRVVVPSARFNAIALVRTAMICQLQAVMLSNLEARKGEMLPAPPYWMVEGLTQGVLDKKTPSLEKVIARIDRIGPVPTLESIQDWKEGSPNRMEQWWQEACCYWLLLKSTSKPGDRSALVAWLIQMPHRENKPYWVESEDNQKWWRKVLTERTAERTPLRDEVWTREELQKCMQFKAVLKGDKEAKEFNLAQLPKPPLEFMSSKPFEEVMKNMILLQARANLLWQDVIQSYRYAYAFWLKGKYVLYQKEIANAEEKARNVTEFMEKTNAYLDWYQVNNPAPGPKFSALLKQSLAFEDSEALAKTDQATISAKLTKIENDK